MTKGKNANETECATFPYSIQKKLREVILAYNEETGIAVTFVSMEWFEVMGGGFKPGKIKVEAQSH